MTLPKCVLIGFTIPDEDANRLFAMDPVPAVQTHKFAWSLARSLAAGGFELRLLSSYPVQSYPLVKKIVFYPMHFMQGEFSGDIIGFLNIAGAKHIGRLLGCLTRLGGFLGKRRPDVVFIHGVHSPYLLFGLLLRALGIPVIPVLTDPSGVALATDSGLSRRLKAVDRFLVGGMLQRMSALAALAPELTARLGGRLPEVIFPGIVGKTWLDTLAMTPRRGANIRPTVLYAGTLMRAYGAALLLDAARQMPEVDFRIFGRGECETELRECGLANLYYGGQLSADALAEEMLAADFLINCRPASSAQARASFPSKLLEYLAVGKPVITTRLAAIPPELAETFLYIDGESPEAVVAAIRSACALDAEARAAWGRKGQTVAMSNYSEEAIGQHLARLVGALPSHRQIA